MIPIFYHVIKNDIVTNMTIILDMKSLKCPYTDNTWYITWYTEK